MPRDTPTEPVADEIKCRLVRWFNRRMTFADIAVVARASGVEVRSLIALHPSFHLGKQGKRIAP